MLYFLCPCPVLLPLLDLFPCLLKLYLIPVPLALYLWTCFLLYLFPQLMTKTHLLALLFPQKSCLLLFLSYLSLTILVVVIPSREDPLGDAPLGENLQGAKGRAPVLPVDTLFIANQVSRTLLLPNPLYYLGDTHW